MFDSDPLKSVCALSLPVLTAAHAGEPLIAMFQYDNFARENLSMIRLSLEYQSHLPMRMADSFRILKPMADEMLLEYLFGRLQKPSSLKHDGTDIAVKQTARAFTR
jgi:hypothetical protein